MSHVIYVVYLKFFFWHPAFYLATQSREITRTVDLKKSHLSRLAYSLLSSYNDFLSTPPPATGSLHKLVALLGTVSFLTLPHKLTLPLGFSSKVTALVKPFLIPQAESIFLFHIPWR